MKEKLSLCRATFGEQFPLMLLQGVEDDEIAAIIETCLEAGEPYEVELNAGVKY